jgi:DNA-binding YbaB/EbfC family protein
LFNPKQLQKQIEEAQKVQAELQEALEALRVEGSAGGGMVKVTADGNGKVKAVKIEPTVVDPDDLGLLEDLVLAAVGEAQRKAREAQSEEVQRRMGGLLGGMGIGR